MEIKHNIDIFSYLSRATIIIPILIILFALFLKLLPDKKVNVSSVQSQPKITPTKKPVASSSATLDLKGPWVCDYSSFDATISASIKDKKIYANFKKNKELENILIKGDCFYNWDKGEITGKKMCGISSYLEIFESLQQFGLFDIKSLFSYLPNLGLNIGIKDTNIDWAKVCHKKIVDESRFILPKNVTFKEFSGLIPSPK